MKKQYQKPEMELLWMQQHCILIVKSLDGVEDVEWVDDGIPSSDDDV